MSVKKRKSGPTLRKKNMQANVLATSQARIRIDDEMPRFNHTRGYLPTLPSDLPSGPGVRISDEPRRRVQDAAAA